MGLRINTNVQSLVAQQNLHHTKERFDHTLNKLASGSRIIRAMDDAAGLAISENLRSELRATAQNINNATNGLFLLETAEGSLNQITNICIRMRELAVQAASDTNGDKERAYLDAEYQQIKEELERISQSTQYNGRPLLNGEGGELAIQVGPNNVEELDRIVVNVAHEITLGELELDGLEINSKEAAQESIEPVTEALDKIAFVRANIGSSESRLNSTISNLMEYEKNTSGAFSRIRDADMAHETAEQAKYNILNQAGTAVLSQANQAPALALKLLGN